MSYYVRCTNPRCREIYRSGDLSYNDGIFMMKGFCKECGEQVENLSKDERVCNDCEKALAMPKDDVCGPCAEKIDVADEDAFFDDFPALEAEARQKPIRELKDKLISIARCAQMPLEEVEP